MPIPTNEFRGEEKEINGSTYRVGYLDPHTASDMAVDLFKVLGPAFASAMSGRPGAPVVLPTDDAAPPVLSSMETMNLKDAIESLVKTLDKSVLRDVMAKLATVTKVTRPDGTTAMLSQCFNIQFSGKGKLSEMYSWLFFAVQVNFGDFFSTVTTN